VEIMGSRISFLVSPNVQHGCTSIFVFKYTSSHMKHTSLQLLFFFLLCTHIPNHQCSHRSFDFGSLTLVGAPQLSVIKGDQQHNLTWIFQNQQHLVHSDPESQGKLANCCFWKSRFLVKMWFMW